MIPMRTVTRRRVLRGVMGGGAVTVGLPFLDCFLNANGTALASGAALPTCFGTFFYGLGLTPGRWEPKTIGPKYEMAPALAALAPYKEKINIYSGMKVFLDGHPNQVHVTGPQVVLGGEIPRTPDTAPASIDTVIADVLGARSRFRSIEVSSVGTSQSLSRRGTAINPAETSPAALYARIFGTDFKDPNAAEFTPDPQAMARRSALSAVAGQRQSLLQDLGAEDRARLDEYFTSVRELENQIELSLQKPAPLAACSVPTKGNDAQPGTVVEDVLVNSKLFSLLISHALACGQTRVFNSVFSQAASNVRRAGSADTHHVLTHEEGIDPAIGYQPKTAWFNDRSIEGLATLVAALEGIREGDQTLLDRTLLFATTDTGLAKVHALDNVPMITIGKAGGKLKTGIHFQATSDPVTRVGLTVQQVMGVAASSWGGESNQTSKKITEVMA